MDYRRALVREPGNSYKGCISSHPLHHTLDLSKAREQHARYCEVLSELGLEVIRVSRDDVLPDSCFVEDNAVVYRGKALICRMAKEGRRGEQPGVAAVLEEYMPVRWAEAPATIEGGDVIHLPDRLICGLTQRTNLEGVAQMRDWLGITVDTIEDPGIMHLKSYITSLGNGRVIATARYADHPALNGLKVLRVPEGEEYAADTLTVDDTVLMPKGYPESHAMVREAGYHVIPMDVSEIEKCDGALTCLSILF
ncbi:MAG: arginine deiminase-related protein [Candidatus Bathyarchaeota archaeon]|jgi:dimethylargininase